MRRQKRVDCDLYIRYIRMVNAIVKTSAFKSGNSVAVRLPKAFGVKPGDMLEIEQQGRDLKIHVVNDPEYHRAQLAELLRKLNEIGPIEGGDPNDGRIEFADRPGLY